MTGVPRTADVFLHAVDQARAALVARDGVPETMAEYADRDDAPNVPRSGVVDMLDDGLAVTVFDLEETKRQRQVHVDNCPKGDDCPIHDEGAEPTVQTATVEQVHLGPIAIPQLQPSVRAWTPDQARELAAILWAAADLAEGR